MKNLKTIFIIMILLISCQQTIFADINFQKNNFTKWDGDARRVIYTGRGYFAGEYAPQPNEKCLYYSENGYSWKKLNADIRKKMGLFDGVYGTFPYKKVIETDDLFIVCNTAFKKGESSSRTGTLTVLDKNFNILKEITTER